uniref:Uncharacterized protein n=1 Tax=Amphimedon queenslandica TaxID=400682 RepID=A0A1X7TUM7_AMPQE
MLTCHMQIYFNFVFENDRSKEPAQVLLTVLLIG